MNEPPHRPTLEERPLPVRVVTLTFTLLLLFGVTYLSVSASPRSLEGGQVTILTGFVLLVASVAGQLASSVGLPRLTGFLVVGMLAGPSILGILPQGVVAELRLIDEFALALIAMLAGGELKIEALRPRARTIAVTTLAVTAVVWLGMALVVMAVRPLLPFLLDLPFTATVGVALLLGIWAANSSPDLTVAVIEETGSKGPLADVILGITIVKDVVVIVLFTLTMALVGPLIDPSQAFSAHVFVSLGQHVGGAIVVGALLGWLFSLYLGGEPGKPRPPLATFLFAYAIVVISHRLHVELLLAGVTAGFVIENLSPAGDRMIRGIESVSVVIFAFFFAIAGASLDLGAVREFWLAALILFGARLLLTFLGARYGTRWSGAGELVRERTWQGLVSQGGVTLGLVILIEEAFPAVGAGVVALGMAVILGNILGGPVILKQALAADGSATASPGGADGSPAPEPRRSPAPGG
jgi:Kef-type K+ transport system membrane component KefB